MEKVFIVPKLTTIALVQILNSPNRIRDESIDKMGNLDICLPKIYIKFSCFVPERTIREAISYEEFLEHEKRIHKRYCLGWMAKHIARPLHTSQCERFYISAALSPHLY